MTHKHSRPSRCASKSSSLIWQRAPHFRHLSVQWAAACARQPLRAPAHRAGGDSIHPPHPHPAVPVPSITNSPCKRPVRTASAHQSFRRRRKYAQVTRVQQFISSYIYTQLEGGEVFKIQRTNILTKCYFSSSISYTKLYEGGLRK